MPPELGNVVFTCTGSEANDLAVRVSKAVTGGTGSSLRISPTTA